MYILFAFSNILYQLLPVRMSFPFHRFSVLASIPNLTLPTLAHLLLALTRRVHPHALLVLNGGALGSVLLSLPTHPTHIPTLTHIPSSLPLKGWKTFTMIENFRLLAGGSTQSLVGHTRYLLIWRRSRQWALETLQERPEGVYFIVGGIVSSTS
ncbi:hypothetical protein EDB19DRAFT_1708084 [Suillus lakei]|nr:hypothetical protein EDB19DRAFT_1708084 [Suillus lakei]